MLFKNTKFTTKYKNQINDVKNNITKDWID